MPEVRPLGNYMIQAPGPKWLAVRNSPVNSTRGEFYWTGEVDKALKLINANQAELVACAVRELSPELFAFEKMLENAQVTPEAVIA